MHQDHGTLVDDEPAVPPELDALRAAPGWVQLELPLDVASVVPPAWVDEAIAGLPAEAHPLTPEDDPSLPQDRCAGQLELPLDLLDDPAALEAWRAL